MRDSRQRFDASPRLASRPLRIEQLDVGNAEGRKVAADPRFAGERLSSCLEGAAVADA